MRASHFSVVISCYNQAAFICEAIDSALEQRHPAKEIIVVDDGSTDGSDALLERYGDKISLIRLRENRGANAARNTGASTATGQYLVFLDGDDVMLPWALEVYESVVTLKEPKVILSSLHFFTGSAQDSPLDEPHLVEYCEYQTLMEKDRPYRASASAIVVKRETFFAAGGWTEQIFPMEDLDLIVKLGYSGRTVQILSPATTCYRVHSANTVSQVRRCIGMLNSVIQRSKPAVYPGATLRPWSRYAFVGGPAWFWVKKGMRAGFYVEALRLFAYSWPMICAASWQRIGQRLQGRRYVKSFELSAQS
jgi:glycosyltransferase involved in cell wall biosynthesis